MPPNILGMRRQGIALSLSSSTFVLQMTRWPSSWRCGRRSWRCWASPLPSATSTPPSPRATRSTWCRRLPSFLSLPHPARLFHPLRPRLTFASDVCA
uniref:Uncharacterized protein n=1 Tax=Zea mays TaxID=4577 RepID=B4FKC7_MAIZE|nr:unknown [Zea mays]